MRPQHLPGAVLVNVETSFDYFLAVVTLIQRSEELLVFASNKRIRRAVYGVPSRQNRGPLLKVSPDWAVGGGIVHVPPIVMRSQSKRLNVLLVAVVRWLRPDRLGKRFDAQ